MDEMTDKLSGLLSDPESVEKLKSMASMFFGNKDSEPPKKEREKEEEKEKEKSVALSDSFDPSMLIKVKKIMEQMNRTDDPKTRLLLALKPYMSQKRVASIEQAMQFMQIIQVFNLVNGG